MHHKEIESVCTYCGVGCDIVAQVDENANAIVKITADKDGYVSQGKLCIKGKYGFDFVASEARIRRPRIAKRFLENNPQIRQAVRVRLEPLDETWYETDLDTAVEAAAMKLTEIRTTHGDESFCAIGGARTSCESAYLFQKFCRHTMNSPHLDNCARV